MAKNYLQSSMYWLGLASIGISCTQQSAKESTSTATIAPSSQEGKPNIIYILCDDAGWGDFSCYGQKKFTTPHIDQLAAQGIRFTDHYAGSSVSAPSRSALLTGQHTGHTPVRGNKEVMPEGQNPMPKDTFNMAKMLKKQGYTTGIFGKWGLGHPDSESTPNKQGFDEFYGYNCQRQAHLYYPMYLRHNGEKVLLENTKEEKKQYTHELIHKQALQFIDQNKEKPFFLYLPYTVPHAELLVPEDTVFNRFKAMYPQGEAYHDPQNTDPNLSSMEHMNAGVYGNQAYPRAAFATMMTYLDRAVGDVMAKLEENGLTENTIIIFSSDNGPHEEGGADPYFFKSFGPFKGVKRDLYEGGIRVPMIVKWNDHIKAGTVTDHPSAFWDVLPTVAEITGGQIPTEHAIDGISFLPTLKGEDKQQKKHLYLYWEFHELGGRMAVRIGNWKVVQYNLIAGKDAPLELYDLTHDLGETTNLAQKHPEIIQQAQEIFKQARISSQEFPLAGIDEPQDNI